MRAGLVLGLVSVPDGLACGLLAGLSPLAGLHAYLFGTLAGALTTSSVIMSVRGTGAMAVIIADVPGVGGAGSTGALATLGVLTGLFMLAAGLARLGTLVRYVPAAVLTGFVNAVAVNIILAQLADATGYTSDAPGRLLRAVDTVLHVTAFHAPSVALSIATVLMIMGLARTSVGSLGLVLAIVAASVAATFVPGLDIPILADLTAVPQSLPGPVLPDLGMVGSLLVPAASLTFVGLVQGAAISRSVPNPDGSPPRPSRDFAGQGVANLVSALFQGMPVGGSMSSTSLVMTAGGRGRVANLTAAAVMALTILALGPIAGFIAMPALAALLVVIGVRTFTLKRAVMIWRIGKTQAAVMSLSFLLTLLVPMHYAVLAGVGLSITLFVARQANRMRVVRWVIDPDGALPLESDPPAELAAGDIVVLNPYGNLFFASADAFTGRLPTAGNASSTAVVVLRLRGHEELGATLITALTTYRDTLDAAGAHLVLTGVGERVLAQLRKSGALAVLGEANVFPAEPRVGGSLRAGLARAEQLRRGQGDPEDPPPGPEG